MALALQQSFPNSRVVCPTTRHPVRLATLSRQHELVLLSLRLSDRGPLELSHREKSLLAKLAGLQQTCVLLQSRRPVALEQWWRDAATLLWAPTDTPADELVALLCSGQLPFDLPFYGEHISQAADGGWQLCDGVRPAFAKGKAGD